jgi:uncharacterized protein
MRRSVLLACATLVLAAAVGVLAAGAWLSRPAQRNVGPAPADLGAVAVRLPVSATLSLAGWYARGTGRGAVLLLHGVRGDRAQMLGRARLLRAAGYSVLLVDLPAHGESGGARIGFGAREGAGVRAALRFLRDALPGEPIGVIGVSLGAAALVLSRPSPAPDAVVLESMYPTLADAVANRLALRLGEAGRLLAPALLWQLPLWLDDLSADDLRPIVALADLAAPVLIASGTQDRHTTWAETLRLFDAARPPKALWAVQDAAHVDLHAHDPDAYRARVLAHLAQHLRAPARP